MGLVRRWPSYAPSELRRVKQSAVCGWHSTVCSPQSAVAGRWVWRHKLIFLFFSFIFANELCGQCDFIAPVHHKIVSSGSFGEPRSAHFHSGIDIKPFKGAGRDEIIAIGDGYISRILMSPDGYGKAIYIDHPCGFTSVYAHLDRFSEQFKSYVDQVRIASRQSEIDQYPPPHSLPVSRGEVLGFMGNSGNSFGAHLHFEIRTTSSETPVNPTHFGIGPQDGIPPVIRGIMVYNLDPRRNVLKKRYYKAVRNSRGRYSLEKELILSEWPLVGLGIHTYDQSDGASNHNGIYNLEMRKNGVLSFSFALDSIPFDKSKFLHAHMDYERKRNNQYVHKCYSELHNSLDIYDFGSDGGTIITYDVLSDNIEILIRDAHSNASKLNFSIRRGEGNLNVENRDTNAIMLRPETSTDINMNDINLHFPTGSVIHTTDIKCDSIGGGVEISTQKLTPLFKYYKITIKAEEEKAEVARRNPILMTYDDKRRMVNLGGEPDSLGNIIAYANSFGEIYIYEDKIAPVIEVINLPSAESQKLKLRVKDNLKSSRKLTRLRYTAYLDDEWVPLDYDLKNDLVECEIDSKEGQLRRFECKVEDYSGNSTTYGISFMY